MALYVPRVGLSRFLSEIIADTLTLRLYSNDHAPAAADTSASYTEASGGGYAAQALSSLTWTADATANPVIITYNSFVTFNFTGATAVTLQGYYVTRASGEVVFAQQFPVADRPFSPVNGSYVKIKPRLTADNA